MGLTYKEPRPAPAATPPPARPGAAPAICGGPPKGEEAATGGRGGPLLPLLGGKPPTGGGPPIGGGPFIGGGPPIGGGPSIGGGMPIGGGTPIGGGGRSATTPNFLPVIGSNCDASGSLSAPLSLHFFATLS
mmetsp:Transcript_105204/g.267299  ORF Transcript_105204/g.267299 Transcript_105204/m.267299 type:complete len:132 (-) Transcript_105204:807-1202(-)